ncbi:MAG TPA: hypothetical protein PLU50_01375 [Pseudobdellovibrionaceae bacterium]|nr:hypothetical protein [Pseudobdellovibrionaceae bacterium]
MKTTTKAKTDRQKPEAEDADLNSQPGDRGINLSDAVKKVFAAGVGAAFLTEESIRNYVAELRLPKELLNLLLQGAAKSKDEITQKVTREVINMVQKIDFTAEFAKLAETHKFRISMEIDVVKKDESSKPDGSTKA